MIVLRLGYAGDQQLLCASLVCLFNMTAEVATRPCADLRRHGPSTRFCLGLFDTCPGGAAALRMAQAGGQVLDKARGRKPRAVPRWSEVATALWR